MAKRFTSDRAMFGRSVNFVRPCLSMKAAMHASRCCRPDSKSKPHSTEKRRRDMWDLRQIQTVRC